MSEATGVYVVRDVLHISAEDIAQLLDQWKVCKNDINRFLRTRAVPPEIFFARIRELGMEQAYYDARSEWMMACDRDLIQKAIVVVRRALEANSENMAQWVLSRRCAILFGSPEEQDRILNKARSGLLSGGDNLDPEHLGIKVLPLNNPPS